MKDLPFASMNESISTTNQGGRRRSGRSGEEKRAALSSRNQSIFAHGSRKEKKDQGRRRGSMEKISKRGQSDHGEVERGRLQNDLGLK